MMIHFCTRRQPDIVRDARHQGTRHPKCKMQHNRAPKTHMGD